VNKDEYYSALFHYYSRVKERHGATNYRDGRTTQKNQFGRDCQTHAGFGDTNRYGDIGLQYRALDVQRKG